MKPLRLPHDNAVNNYNEIPNRGIMVLLQPTILQEIIPHLNRARDIAALMKTCKTMYEAVQNCMKTYCIFLDYSVPPGAVAMTRRKAEISLLSRRKRRKIDQDQKKAIIDKAISKIHSITHKELVNGIISLSCLQNLQTIDIHETNITTATLTLLLKHTNLHQLHEIIAYGCTRVDANRLLVFFRSAHAAQLKRLRKWIEQDDPDQYDPGQLISVRRIHIRDIDGLYLTMKKYQRKPQWLYYDTCPFVDTQRALILAASTLNIDLDIKHMDSSGIFQGFEHVKSLKNAQVAFTM